MLARLLALTLVLKFISNPAHGLMCYLCGETSDLKSLPKPCDAGYGKLQEPCPPPTSPTRINWCFNKTTDGKVTERGCIQAEKTMNGVNGTMNGCETNGEGGYNFCWCTTDLCNNAPAHDRSVIFLLALTVIILTAAYAAFTHFRV